MIAFRCANFGAGREFEAPRRHAHLVLFTKLRRGSGTSCPSRNLAGMPQRSTPPGAIAFIFIFSAHEPAGVTLQVCTNGCVQAVLNIAPRQWSCQKMEGRPVGPDSHQADDIVNRFLLSGVKRECPQNVLASTCKSCPGAPSCVRLAIRAPHPPHGS